MLNLRGETMAKITNARHIQGLKTFNCFSQRLSHAIQNKLGICPIDIFTHANGKIVNVYIITPELSEFLTEWTKNKPRKEVQN